jgi:hypothetical protein
MILLYDAIELKGTVLKWDNLSFTFRVAEDNYE